jgi:hypothetical protein
MNAPLIADLATPRGLVIERKLHSLFDLPVPHIRGTSA